MRKRMISLLCILALCLTLLPSTAWATGSAYTESTNGDTITYTFTTFHNVNAGNNYGAQTFRVSAGENVVLDFTHVPQSEVADAEFILDLTADNLTVTVKGDPAVDYGNSDITIYSEPYGKTLSVTLELEDFQTDGSVTNRTYDKDHPFQVFFDGTCRVGSITAAYLGLSAADDAATLRFLSSCFISAPAGALTMEGGTYQMGYHYISYPQVTIKDANITFSQGSGSPFEPRYIQAEQLTIENSTIQGVANVYSVKTHGTVNDAYKETFEDSSITVQNSTITYAEDMINSYYTGMLCNAETITIVGSTITGAASTASIACIGGIFETLSIKDSELYIESDYANDNLTPPAIGPARSSYTSYMVDLRINNPSITIEDSVVEAASRHSAAIGLPRLNSDDNKTSLPQLSITIKGSSDITATSVYSPAIGGSSMAEKIQDDGLVAAEIVVDNPGSIGAWEPVDGGNIPGELSLAAAPASSGLNTFSAGADVSLMAATEDSVLGDIKTARSLLDDCTITIASTDSDTPTISAKSGVLAVYGNSVTVTDTNLVQATMVRTTGSSWSVYPMETPGDVTIDTDPIGQLGYGYASVAGTGISQQTNAAMTFGDSPLKNVLDDSTTFTTNGSGFEAFYVTPQELPLSGTVTLTGGSDNGTAAVGDTLTADLTDLSPVRAKDVTSGSYAHLSFQWYRDSEPISEATGTTYKLTDADSGKIITCVVSVKTGDTMFTGSVTSSAVLVGTTSLAAPELASRTEDSITLVNAGTGYKYSKDYGQNWQDSPEFTGLTKGTAYTFILKDSSNNLSTAATFYTLSDKPNIGDFSIDYVAERLTFPEGVLLYSDADCTICLNAYSPRTWISISDYTDKTLYARYSTVDASDTKSVTEIKIPARPTVSEVMATVTEDSISFTGASGVAYRLTLDDAQVGKIKNGDGTRIEFTGLQPGTEYVLTMRKEASNENKNFRSAQVNQTIRTKGSYAKDSTLLVKAGESSRSYDLTDLLGGLNITKMEKTDGSFVTDATNSGNTVTLTFDTTSATAGATGTVTVTAKDADDTSTLTLTLTVKAVEVMAVNRDSSVFWVKEEAHPGYVGMTESRLSTAWNQGLETAGLTNHTNENSFALVPRYVVGGGTATKEITTPEITWQVTSAADAANTDFTVLYIDSTKAATQITQVEKQDNTLTFNARNQTALYLVAWKELQDVTMTVKLRNNTTTLESTEFQYGQSLTASVDVDSTSSLPDPSGTVTLWLGNPNAADSIELGEAELDSLFGSASIQYTLGDDTHYSNDTQTLYIVYSGDTNYNSKTATETVIFKAAAPEKPVLSAEAGLDSVKLTWEAPATHGAPITGYELAVKQDGSTISGSPFTIDADATEHTVSKLESGKEYTFTLTVKSAAGNVSSQAVSVTTLSADSGTILVAAGTAGEKTYDLSQWLGSTAITSVDTSQASGYTATANGTQLTLTYPAATAGNTATLTVTAGTTVLTLTVEAVDVMAQTDTVFWVKNDGAMTSEQTALTNHLSSLGMGGAEQSTFALLPRTIVGGGTAAPTGELPKITVNSTEPLTDSRIVVLYIRQGGTSVTELTPAVSVNSVKFSAQGTDGLYLVAWKALETPTIDVTLSGGTDHTFEQGSTITATVTVSGGSGTPSGTVTAYLGDPASGSQIGQGNLSGGTAAIELSTSGMTTGAQTLTFVYGANGNYESASTTETITLVPAGSSLSKTILLPVGSGVEWEYDLSALLGGASITNTEETTDSDNILSSVTYEGTSTLKLTGSATQDNQTATVTVTASKADGGTLTLNLTVEAVTVLGEQNGVFFVQENVDPDLVGMTTDELLAAWDAVKEAEGFQNAGTQHSFTIRNRNIIGGEATTAENAATVTWTPSDSQIPVAEGSFLVLHIGKGDSAAQAITYNRTEDSLTFTADGEDGLYCVVYKEATGGAVTVSAELQKNGTAASSFRYGDTLTAVVTIEPATTATGLKPGGTVNLYLGDPADGGKLLASGQMSDGSGTITYTLNDASILSNAEQTLYIVYSGDNNYLGDQATVKAYLRPASSGGGTVTPPPEEDYSSCDGGESCPLSAFTDTDPTAWYHDGVHYCLDEGLMEGYGNGLFGPNDQLSRAMLVQILYNMEGQPAVTGASAFDDVADGAWYTDAVTWAASQDIVDGYGDGKYGPDDPITREQLAAILYRYAQNKGYDVSVGEDTNILSYTDAFDVAEYAIPAMQWACGAGVIEGVTESTLEPQGNATRAQVATMLMRFCSYYIDAK